MSGMRPALAICTAPAGESMKDKNAAAAGTFLDPFKTEIASPGKKTTLLIGLVENGGTIAPTFEPICWVYCATSQLPSSGAMAALPSTNCPTLLRSVRASEFTQPLVYISCHIFNWVCTTEDVQGICPL